MQFSEIAILVMAGGSSQRFGHDDKLLAELGGLSLGLKAATTLADFGWAQQLVVARASLASSFDALGYRVIGSRAGNGLGDNMALGAGALGDVAGVLIILADMPFVTKTHVQAIVETASSTASIVCTQIHRKLMPPVLIGCDYFATLKALSGDQGAKGLFSAAGPNLVYVTAPANMTADIDTRQDYERALGRAKPSE